jgi:hypothetical protein
MYLLKVIHIGNGSLKQYLHSYKIVIYLRYGEGEIFRLSTLMMIIIIVSQRNTMFDLLIANGFKQFVMKVCKTALKMFKLRLLQKI